MATSDRDQHRQPDELEGQRQPLRDQCHDVLAQPIALPEIPLEGAPDPRDVLRERVADQAELVTEHLGRGRVHLLPAEHDQDRIAGGEADQAERDERDEEEHGDQGDDAPERIGEDVRELLPQAVAVVWAGWGAGAAAPAPSGSGPECVRSGYGSGRESGTPGRQRPDWSPRAATGRAMVEADWPAANGRAKTK